MTSGEDLVLAEIRRLRAELGALAGSEAARRMWLPGYASSHLVLPVMHYRLAGWLRRRLRLRRAAITAAERTRRQRRAALWLTVFAAARTLIWITAMALLCLHWAGAGGAFLRSFTALSSSVVFVTFISFYCNASTDAANLVAGIAALFSAEGRAGVIADVAGLDADIARLASLEPGAEAQALAAGIRSRLAGEGGSRE